MLKSGWNRVIVAIPTSGRSDWRTIEWFHTTVTCYRNSERKALSIAFKIETSPTWRDRKICDLLATLLDKMNAIEESDGTTLLDNSLIVMGSSLRTGHKRRNLPILFALCNADTNAGTICS